MITLVDKAFFLKKNKLFNSLDLDLLLILSEKAELISFEKNDVVFLPNSETHRIYLILEGEILVEDRNKKRIAVLKKEECFGDESLFNQKPHDYGALCLKDSQLLVLGRSHILSLLEQSPALASSLLEIYTENLEFRKR